MLHTWWCNHRWGSNQGRHPPGGIAASVRGGWEQVAAKYPLRVESTTVHAPQKGLCKGSAALALSTRLESEMLRSNSPQSRKVASESLRPCRNNRRIPPEGAPYWFMGFIELLAGLPSDETTGETVNRFGVPFLHGDGNRPSSPIQLSMVGRPVVAK